MAPGDDFYGAMAEVRAARSARELFGEDLGAARKTYRRLARVLHPDVVLPEHRAEALNAAALLNVRWDEYKTGVSDVFKVTTKRRTYTVEPVLVADGISNLYPVSWTDGLEQYGLMRFPRSPKNNDLIAAEAKALKQLDDGDPAFRVYAPTLVETFRHRDSKTRVDRRVNVTARLDGFFTLAEVRRAFPDGMDGRDVAWIWRRLLAGAGWAHRAGLINGAILPDHVLIHPIMHGVVLANWCYSAEVGGTVPAVVKDYRRWYPQSVLDKKPAEPQMDIHLISKTMEFLFGPNMPMQFRAFVKGCTLPFGGLPDAWDVQAEFDELLLRLYGPRKYRPLVMPV